MMVKLEAHVKVDRVEDTGRHLVSLAVNGDIQIAEDLVSIGLANPIGQAQVSRNINPHPGPVDSMSFHGETF